MNRRLLTHLGSWVLLFWVTHSVSAQVEEAWVARYDGEGGGDDRPHSLALDAPGNLYVTGRSAGDGTGWDYATLKYDSEGRLLWVARYDGPVSRSDVPVAIAVDSEGNVYVTGWSQSDAQFFTATDFATIKYDSDGNQLWVARHDAPPSCDTCLSEDRALGLAVDQEGNVHVAGLSNGNDQTTIKYGPDGNTLWVARFEGAPPVAMALDGLGNVYLAGNVFAGPTGKDYSTIKYASDGRLMWSARYAHAGGAGSEEVRAIAVDSAGNVCVTGSSEASGQGEDFATVKYDRDGQLAWVTRYNGPPGGDDGAEAIALDAADNVYVAGASEGDGTSFDFTTIKYASDGRTLWAARYDGPAGESDGASAIAVDTAGNVFVTGTSRGLTGSSDYATVKYDPDGRALWVARYDGPGGIDDTALGLALGESGNVYVTGASGSSDGAEDQEGFLTIRYVETWPFIRGDATANGRVDFRDVVSMLFHIIRSRSHECADALDAGDSGSVELSDVIFLLRHIFRRGPAPMAPFLACDFDPTPDGLLCESFLVCP